MKKNDPIFIIVPTKQTSHQRHHRSKSDVTFQSDLSGCLVEWFVYAYTPREFELHHRVNRDVRRSTNKNLVIQQISIMELARRFLTDSSLRKEYSLPHEFSFYRSVHRSSCERVSYNTTYYYFRHIGDRAFQEKHPDFSFGLLTKAINSQLIASTINPITPEQFQLDYTMLLGLRNHLKK